MVDVINSSAVVADGLSTDECVDLKEIVDEALAGLKRLLTEE